MTDLTPRPVPVSAPGRRQRNLLPMIILGLVLVAGGIIVTQFLRSAVDYYCNVDEIGVRSGCDADRRLRVQGTVAEGSVTTDGIATNFVVSFNDVNIDVRYEGEPGGIFRECIPVVVHGRFDAATGTFLGDRVEVKHSDEYVAVNDDRLTEADADAAACRAGAA